LTLPEEFHSSDKEDLTRFAVGLKWQKDGKWFQVYIRSNSGAHLTADMRSEDVCMRVRAFLRFFLQETYNEPPEWQEVAVPIRLTDCTFDFLSQQVKAVELPRMSSLRIDYPTSTNLDGKLRSLGAQNIGGKLGEWGPRPNSQPSGEGQWMRYICTSESMPER
jgi:hypothetical protein